jgi:hypothetical protein
MRHRVIEAEAIARLTESVRVESALPMVEPGTQRTRSCFGSGLVRRQNATMTQSAQLRFAWRWSCADREPVPPWDWRASKRGQKPQTSVPFFTACCGSTHYD